LVPSEPGHQGEAAVLESYRCPSLPARGTCRAASRSLALAAHAAPLRARGSSRGAPGEKPAVGRGGGDLGEPGSRRARSCASGDGSVATISRARASKGSSRKKPPKTRRRSRSAGRPCSRFLVVTAAGGSRSPRSPLANRASRCSRAARRGGPLRVTSRRLTLIALARAGLVGGGGPPVVGNRSEKPEGALEFERSFGI